MMATPVYSGGPHPGDPTCRGMTDGQNQRVVVTYLPAGRSEPDELSVWKRPESEPEPELTDRAIEQVYESGDEPIEVRSALTGQVLWQNPRFYDLD